MESWWFDLRPAASLIRCILIKRGRSFGFALFFVFGVAHQIFIVYGFYCRFILWGWYGFYRESVRKRVFRRYNGGVMQKLLIRMMVLALSAAMSSGVHAQSSQNDVREELESGLIATPRQRAEHYLKHEEWDKLLAHATRWTRDFPGESTGWHYLGQAMQAKKNQKGAADAYKRAWALSDRKNYRIIESIADLYVSEKEWGKAVDSYKIAVELRPRRAVLWEKLTASLFFRGGEPGSWELEAAETLKKTLTFGQYVNNYKLWQRYAFLQDGLGTDEEEQYRGHWHVVRLNPDDIPSWERLYELEKARGNTEESVEIIERLSRLDKTNAVANLHYGIIAAKGGRKVKADEYLNYALQDDRLSSSRRSQIYMILGDLRSRPLDALTYYRQAISAEPSNMTAWEQAIIMLRGSNQRKLAQASYEELILVEGKLSRNLPVTEADAQVILGKVSPDGEPSRNSELLQPKLK